MTSLNKYDRVLEVERFLIKFNIDFCFIQETHLKFRFIHPIKNYSIFRDYSLVGTLIFARNKFKVERVVLPSATDIGVTGIKVIGGNNKGLFLFSIYIPCIKATNVLTNKQCRTYDMLWEHKAIMLTASLNMVALNNPARKVYKWRKTDWKPL